MKIPFARVIVVVALATILAAALLVAGLLRAHSRGPLSAGSHAAESASWELPPNAGSQPGNARVVLIDGTCASGRPLGDLSWYGVPLRARKNDLGYVRIRSNAVFDAAAENVIGTAPCGTILWGEGPLKDGDVSAGIGYAVAVQDKQGHVCRGYVWYTVVDVLAVR